MSDDQVGFFGTVLGKLPKAFPDVISDGCPYCRDLVASVLRNELLMGKSILSVSLAVEISGDQMITLVIQSAEPGERFGEDLIRVPVRFDAHLEEGQVARIGFTEATFYILANPS
jgi:hypothetical protein